MKMKLIALLMTIMGIHTTVDSVDFICGKNKEKVSISSDIEHHFGLIKLIAEDYDDPDNGSLEIPLVNVSADGLRNIIATIRHKNYDLQSKNIDTLADLLSIATRVIVPIAEKKISQALAQKIINRSFAVNEFGKNSTTWKNLWSKISGIFPLIAQETPESIHDAINPIMLVGTLKPSEPGKPIYASLSPNGRFKLIAKSTMTPNIFFMPLKTSEVWDQKKAKKLYSIEHCSDSESFSSDSKMLAYGHKDGSISIVDITNNEEICKLNDNEENQIMFNNEQHTDVLRTFFNHDDTLLVAHLKNNTTKVFTIASQEIVYTQDHITDIFFGPNHKVLYMTQHDADNDQSRILRYNLESKQELPMLGNIQGKIRQVAFPQDNEIILRTEHAVQVWNTSQAEQRITVESRNEDFSSTVLDNQTIIAIKTTLENEPTNIDVYNVATSQNISNIQDSEDMILGSSYIGTTIETYLPETKQYKIWNALTGEHINIKDGEKILSFALINTENSKFLAANISNTLQLFEVSQGSFSLKPLSLFSLAHSTKLLSLRSNEEVLAAGFDNNIIEIFENFESSIAPKYTLTGHQAKILGLSFSSDANFLLSLSEDNNVKIWDLATGRCIQTLKLPKNITPIRDIRFVEKEHKIYIKFGRYSVQVYKFSPIVDLSLEAQLLILYLKDYASPRLTNLYGRAATLDLTAEKNTHLRRAWERLSGSEKYKLHTMFSIKEPPIENPFKRMYQLLNLGIPFSLGQRLGLYTNIWQNRDFSQESISSLPKEDPNEIPLEDID